MNMVRKGQLPLAGENKTSLEPIGIIGMASKFALAPDIKTFWRNILAGVDAIGEPLPEWEAKRYLDSNRINTSRGGYLKDLYRFNPKEFGIMPNSIDGGEPDQFLALCVARDALQDAGYLDGDYDHRDTGIVLGHSTYLHRGQGNIIQHCIVLDQTIELLRVVCPSFGEDALSGIRRHLESKLPQVNADIVPSLVPNIMTGRIANRLNLKGPNYLIDAACSSSLLAVNAAIDELRNGRSRMMLAGGVNASLPAEVSVIFTQLGALSKGGKVRPFEAGSDGTLLGEGLGVVVLKRLADALADEDRIYAVILGVGQASDGRGHGLLAPSVEGEALAIERAYASTGVDPATIELVEAHGTGIPLGDQTEISALRRVFGDRKGLQGNVAIGSIKSMISHCIPAAGIAGLIKSALALHHKILPPTLCEKVNPELGIESTPFYVNTTARPWISCSGIQRRAGIDSFGFGGINAHAILEEAPDEACKPLKFSVWPSELCVFSAESDGTLIKKLNQVVNLLCKDTGYSLTDIAATLVAQDANLPHRIAVVAKDTEDLRKKITQAIKRLTDTTGLRWSIRNGIVYSKTPIDGKLAFLFPGEGSQYLNMLKDLALYFDDARKWFDFWRRLYDDVPGECRTDIIFPPQSELTEQRRTELEKRLNSMDVGSEAAFVGGQALYALLKSLGVQPDAMVGHSTGESSALVASGTVESDDLMGLADFVRKLNNVYQHVLGEGKIPTGALLTVGALSQATIEDHIAFLNNGIVIAMDNCVNQLVLYGDKDSIEALQRRLSAVGGICIPLPFDRGYHTSQFSAVSAAFLDYYNNIGLKSPRIPLYSCASAGLFPADEQGVRELAARQWSTKVRFRETIVKMYRDGVRYFVEVGPSGNLGSFVNDILTGEEYLSLASNLRQKNSVEQFLVLLSHLYVNGKGVRVERLFDSRSVQMIDLERGVQYKQQGMPLNNTMPVIHTSEADSGVLREMISISVTAKQGAKKPCGTREPATPVRHTDALNESKAGDHVVAGYLDVMRGFLEQQRMILEQWGTREQPAQEDVNPVEAYTPFLSSVNTLDEQHFEGECRLSVYEDNFLRDHILSGPVSESDPDLSGLSCVPMMVSLEIMAEACALLAGSTAVKIIENIKAFDWIALDDGDLTLQVRAELIGLQKYRSQIVSAGNIVVSAEFSFGSEWCVSGLPDLMEKKNFRWEELYSTGMFHGPIFQSIRRINGWNDQGIDADISEISLAGFFETDKTTGLVLNPVLLDALGQLTACWIAQQVGTDFNSFPSTIERIELYSQCPQNITGVTMRARQQPLDPAVKNVEAPRVWQIECLDNTGKPLFRAKNLTNVYFPVPHRFYEFRRDPLNGWLGYTGQGTGNDDALLWYLPHLTEKFCAQSSSIFMRILAHALLSFDELQQWRDLTANIRQKRQWLLGRACIKEAVRYLIFQQTGQLLYPSDIIVLHDERGHPYVDGAWLDVLAPSPGVSLSHVGQLSLAAVTPAGRPVGVDVEPIGKIPCPNHIADSFTPGEKTLLRGLAGSVLSERILRMWCAKEAAAKYLGVGLQGMPDKFEVSFPGDNWKRAQVSHAGKLIEVNVGCENDLVVALATRHSVTDNEDDEE